MVLQKFSLCAAAISILIFVVGKSDAIQCFNCQSPILKAGEDPCIGAPLQECPLGNAKCLSATFIASAPSVIGETNLGVSALTCYPDMKGKECDFFLSTVQQLSSSTPVEFRLKKCNVCSKDGCNSAPANKVSAFWFVGVCFVIITSLLKY